MRHATGLIRRALAIHVGAAPWAAALSVVLMVVGGLTPVAAAWFTVKGEQGQSYAAFSSDAGRTWGNPIRLDDQGSLGRVDIQLLADGSAVASWVEFIGGRSEFRARRVESSGMKSAPVTVSDTGEGRASGYPRTAIRGNDLVFAWTQSTGEGTQTVKTAIAALP